jgi:site-specific DNA-methyltransferase (adenine-specific)
VKPFYDEEGVTIFHGDCREVLPMLHVRGLPLVDMVLADPPYGDTELAWDVQGDEWLEMSAALMKRSASVWCFGSMRAFMAQARVLSGWKLAQEVVWEKHNGSGFLNDRFRRVHELVLQLYRGRWNNVWREPVKTPDAIARSSEAPRKKMRTTHYGRIQTIPYVSHDGGDRLMTSVIRASSCHGYAVHATQKPIELLAPLIRYSCPLGGVVLDPMMGSGSTLLAARMLGRRAIGIELSEEDCRNAVLRLRGADAKTAKLVANDPKQTKLF